MWLIALIDNYPIARAGFSLLLKEHLSEQFQVIDLDDVHHFGAMEISQSPDVIVLALNKDGRMKVQDDILICKKRFSHARIMVYGDHFDYDYLVELINSGVRGFMLKSCDISQFANGINEIMVRQHFFCGDLLGVILSKLSSSGAQDFLKTENPLSAREKEVAQYLLKGLRTSDIAHRLGRKLTTISTIKANLFRKMNVSNIMELNERMQVARN